ncbi:hypothetical protein ACH427_04010 [Streptomyces sp. NPDC020379]|uniref:hypothetical protein n=1 Tax=Streptomyces sp. NPDC020379 TaxID=3365071 RepID=UPI00378C1F1B
MNIAITIEGVLRNTENDGAIPAGKALYQALGSQHSLYLISDSTDAWRTNRWLAHNGLDLHMRTVHNRKPNEWRDTTQIRLDAVGQLTGAGIKVDLVVEPDPRITAELLALGYPTATLTLPHFAKPEWRPDYDGNLRPWDSLIEEMEAQADAYASDTRRTADPL